MVAYMNAKEDRYLAEEEGKAKDLQKSMHPLQHLTESFLFFCPSGMQDPLGLKY